MHHKTPLLINTSLDSANFCNRQIYVNVQLFPYHNYTDSLTYASLLDFCEQYFS